jgi:O-antigen/teichoic acid export membrane protein
VLKAVGKPRLLVRMHAVSLASMAAFVGAAAVPFGIVGVAIAVSASRCLTAAYGLRHAAALTGLHSGDLQRALAGPVVAAVMMLIAMVVFASALDPLGHDHVLAAVLTVLEALIGAFVYTIVLLLVDGERRRSAGELLAVRQPALAKLVTR